MEIKEIARNSRQAAEQRAVNDPPVRRKGCERPCASETGCLRLATFQVAFPATARSFTAGEPGGRDACGGSAITDLASLRALSPERSQSPGTAARASRPAASRASAR